MTTETSTNSAVAEHEAGRFDQAESIYRAMLEKSPEDLTALIGLGDVLTDSGQPAQAIEFYRKAIAIDPDAPANAGAYDGLAAILQDTGDLDNAIIASKKAAVLRGSAEDAFGVGQSLEYLGRVYDAIDMFQLAAKLHPENYEAHAKAAQYLLTTGKSKESIPHYLAAIQAKPDVAELHCNLASARRQCGDLNEALDSARKAIELKPLFPEAFNVLGAIWKDRRRWNDALTALNRAVQLKPDAADALNNTATVLEAVGRYDEATSYYERAILLRADVLEFHINLATNLLKRGQFARGWDEWEWRRIDPHNTASRVFEQPAWDGSNLDGKTILVHAETALARNIQFLRYIPMIRDRGGKIIFECPKNLAALAGRIEGMTDVIVHGKPLPAFDVHTPLISLGKLFATDLETIPNKMPYHTAKATKIEEWMEVVSSFSGQSKVGIAWPEKSEKSKDRDRNCPVEKLTALTELPDTRFFSLQPLISAPLPSELNLVDLSADLTDLHQTACLIANMDIVIGADTPITHLAAAMGKPTFILLPSNADWVWMLDRADSPWYPTAKLFRHSPDQSWSDRMAALVESCKMTLQSPR